jgi:hypothetical protein
MATLSSLLNNFTYHLEPFFCSNKYGCSIFSFRSTIPMWDLQSDTTTGFMISLPLLMDTHISSVWHVVTLFLSCQVRTPTSPELWSNYSPFFSLLAFTKGGKFFCWHVGANTICFLWLQETCQLWRTIKTVLPSLWFLLLPSLHN